MTGRRRAWRPRADTLVVSGLISATVIASLALLGRLDDAGFTWPPALSFCFLHDVVGIPCPFCGGTRALIALAHGHVGAALAVNPGATVTALVAIACPLIALAPGADALARALRRLAHPAVLWPLVLAEWGYVVVRLTF